MATSFCHVVFANSSQLSGFYVFKWFILPSLLFKTAATFASFKLSLLTQRANRSKDPDQRGVVRTEFANVLKLDLRQIFKYIMSLSIYVPVSIIALQLTVSGCVRVMSFPTSFYRTLP